MMNEDEILTMVRVITYKGPRSWLQRTVDHSLPLVGTYTLPNQATITSEVTEMPSDIVQVRRYV